MHTALLLHNIRSAYNVGSIFRTADAAGVSRIYLTGYTPTPLDRWGRPQKDIAKTALGAEKTVPWYYARTPIVCIETVRKEGWHIVGIEQSPKARDYRTYTLDQPTLFILGNEVRGMSQSLRARCDELIEIPMHGALVRHTHHPRHSGIGKESLNVAVAVGIVLFHSIQTHT
jgi:tRNA G18 (ribose-2'-O)-methylase SpoU